MSDINDVLNDLIDTPSVRYIEPKVAFDIFKKQIDFISTANPNAIHIQNGWGISYKVGEQIVGYYSHEGPSALSVYVEHPSFYLPNGTVNKKSLC